MGPDSDTPHRMADRGVAWLVHRGGWGWRRRALPTEATLRNQRYSERASEAQDRRDREDTATRLITVVPGIRSLALEIREFRGAGDGTVPLVSYRKLVVVDRAPALFEIRCSDTDCSDGGHDLTRAIMAALKEQTTDFKGRDICFGLRRNESCGRRLEYHVTATYDDAAATSETRGRIS